MVDVFISYSRKDSEFARRLADALKATGRESWVDWEGIPYSADWWREIQAGMDSAETVVVIISPDSLASMVCNQEIDHARQNHKRMIPVIHRAVDEQELAGKWFEQAWEQTARGNWAELKKLNWLFFREGDDFERAFASLIETVEQDPEHVRLHTRLLVRAREWENGRQDTSLLLRGNDLREAENWLTFNIRKNPSPTGLHNAYIGAGITERGREEAAERRRRDLLRWLVVLLSVLLVAAVVAGGLAVNQSQVAGNNAATATVAQGQSEFNAGTAVANAFTATVAQGEAQSNATLSANNAETAIANAATATVAQGQAQLSAAEAETQAARADSNAATSEANFRQALETQLRFLADLSRQEYEQGDTRLALLLALKGMEYYPDIYYSQNVRALGDALSLPGIERVRAQPNAFVGAMLNSDESRLLTWDGDGVTRVIDAASWQELMTLTQDGIVLDAHWNADETRILTAARDGTGRVWDAVTGEELLTLQHPEGHQVSGISYAADESVIVTVTFDDGFDTYVYGWDAATGEPIEGYIYRSPLFGFQVVSATGDYFLSGEEDSPEIEVRRTEDGSLVTVFSQELEIDSAYWSPDGELALTMDGDGVARVWSPASSIPLHTIEADGPGYATWVGWGRLISLYPFDSIRRELWDADTGERYAPLPAIEAERYSISPDGTQVAVWDSVVLEDTQVYVYRLIDESDPIVLPQLGELSNVRWSEDSSRLLTWGIIRQAGTDDVLGFVSGWEMAEGQLLFGLSHDDGVRDARWMADGRRIFSKTSSGVHVWEVRDNVTLALDNTMFIRRWQYSPDRSRVAVLQQITRETAIDAGSVLMSDAKTGESLFTLSTFNPIREFAWSPNGEYIVTWADGYEGSVVLWSGEDGRQLLKLPQMDNIRSVVWNHDSTRFVLSNGTGIGLPYKMTVWDASSGEAVIETDLMGAAFSPIWSTDDRLLLMNWNLQVSVWDATSGEQLLAMTTEDYVWGARWNADESKILGWDDRGAYLWSAADGTLIGRFRSSVDNNRYTRWFAGESRVLLQEGSLWDVATGELLVKHSFGNITVSADETEFIIVRDNEASIYATESGELLRTLLHPAEVLIFPAPAVFYSPDGTRILTLSYDGSAFVWERESGELLLVLRHQGLMAAEWTADSQQVETLSSDGTRRLWEVNTDVLLAAARNEQTIPMTNAEYELFFLPTPVPSEQP